MNEKNLIKKRLRDLISELGFMVDIERAQSIVPSDSVHCNIRDFE